MTEHDEGVELAERVDALAIWIKELDAQLRASSTVGDPKALKELAKALEAWNKHDPKLEQRLTNRVDVLADRFATLAGTVNVTATSLAGKDGEIASLRRELEEGTARIESVVRDLRQAGGSDLTELRKTVAELASERKSGASDSRVDSISGEVDVLAQRLDTLSKTVSTTAAGLSGREGELTTLRAQLEETDARAGTLVIELRESIDALSRQVAGLEDSSGNAASIEQYENYVRALAGHVEHLTENLDAVSESVATATESIAANELELDAVSRRFEAASADVDALIAELQATVSALPSTGTIDPEVEDRLQLLGQRIDEVTGQLTELEATMTAQRHESATSEAAIEHELGQVSQRLADVEHGRDAALAALDRASETWAEERTWVRGQLEQLAGAVDDARADGTLEPRLQELAARVEAMEAGQESVSAEVARAAAAWDAERDLLKGELELLAGELSALPAPVPESENAATVERLHELTQRLDSIEHEKAAVAIEISKAQELAARVEAMEAGQESVSAEVARAAAAWDADRDELRIELEALAGEVSALPAPAARSDSEDAAVVELFNDLAQRLDSLEQEKTAVATEISKAQELWATEIGALEARLDTVAATTPEFVSAPNADSVEQISELVRRLEAVEDERGAMPDTTAVADELRDLRVLMNGLRMRLTSSEKELATLASQGDIASRFDDISLRLASLERASIAFAAAPAPPVPGDGRFRVEMRGLDQRMEQLEAAARENRDAVLMQFERLASRLQWRLQQLELESTDAGYSTKASSTKASPPSRARVVPIRSEG